MAVRVLAIGDRFVRSDLIIEALNQEVGRALEISALDLPWPIEPFGRVAEVDEASGSEEQVIEAVGEAEVLFTHVAPITRRVLEAADALRLVVCPRGGPVNVNVEAASENGVAVCYVPGRNAPAVAEYALGLMLDAIRRVADGHVSLGAGEWRWGGVRADGWLLMQPLDTPARLHKGARRERSPAAVRFGGCYRPSSTVPSCKTRRADTRRLR